MQVLSVKYWHIQSQAGLRVLMRVSGRHARRTTVASTTVAYYMDAPFQASVT